MNENSNTVASDTPSSEERRSDGPTLVEAVVNAVIRTSDGVGQTPEPALDDAMAFNERSLTGDDIESIREALV